MLLPSEIPGFQLPNLKQVTSPNGSRYYLHTSGIKLPSVTTLISKYESKEWLKTWKENNGEEVSNQIRNNAAAIGTKVHSSNEAYFTREPYSTDCEEVVTRHKLFLPFLQRIKPIFLEQRFCWLDQMANMRVGFAGSADIVGITTQDFSDILFENKERDIPFTGLRKDTLFVGDYKNFLKAKSPKTLLSKYLQAAAYSLAVEQTTGGRVRPSHGLVIATTKTMLSLFYLNPSQMNWYKFFFKKMVMAYFTKTDFDWKTFNEFSVGYMYNQGWEEKGEKKWIDRDENYLAKQLWTPKVNKAGLAEIQHPYLTFSRI